MKILYIGAHQVESIAEVISKRYTSLEIVTAQTTERIKYIITRGDTIDRAVVFDSFLLSSCDIANTAELRTATQKLIAMLKTENILEIVCIAQANSTGQFFLEELYDVMVNASVHVVGNTIPMADVINYSMLSIAQLRPTCKKDISTSDIYQPNDSVIWSDNKSTMSDWQTLCKSGVISVDMHDKFRLNIALELLDFCMNLASWEYKADLKAEEQAKIVSEAVKQTHQNVDEKPMTRKEKRKAAKAAKKAAKLARKQAKKEAKLAKKQAKREAKLAKKQAKRNK